jgi:hypothetical protein
MVCVPCIVIPVLLYLWYRFIYPAICKVWDPAPFLNRHFGWPPLEDSQQQQEKPQGGDAKAKCPFASKSPTDGDVPPPAGHPATEGVEEKKEL